MPFFGVLVGQVLVGWKSPLNTGPFFFVKAGAAVRIFNSAHNAARFTV